MFYYTHLFFYTLRRNFTLTFPKFTQQQNESTLVLVWLCLCADRRPPSPSPNYRPSKSRCCSCCSWWPCDFQSLHVRTMQPHESQHDVKAFMHNHQHQPCTGPHTRKHPSTLAPQSDGLSVEGEKEKVNSGRPLATAC